MLLLLPILSVSSINHDDKREDIISYMLNNGGDVHNNFSNEKLLSNIQQNSTIHRRLKRNTLGMLSKHLRYLFYIIYANLYNSNDNATF